jgi:PAS domain S-box-containing protein
MFPVEVSANYFEYGGRAYNLALVRDITERKEAEEERAANLQFFQSMDRINRAMQGTNELEQMTGEAIDAMRSIFASDRAFLYYPCDPDASSFEAVMVRSRPEYAVARGVISMTPDTARGFQIVRASSGVVTFGPECDYPLVGDFTKHFGHQSSIGIALYPKTGKPWVLAMQQCSYARVWTPDERKLLEEIARRLADSLTSLLMFRNLSESEEALRESERHLRTLIENLPDCIARFDREGRLLFVNPAVAEAFGVPADQFIGKTLRECGAPGLERQNLVLEGLIKRAFEEGIANSTEAEWVTRQGIRCFDIRHVPEKDETGKAVTVMGISRDITEHKRAEEKIRQQEMELRQVLDLTPQLVGVFGPDRRRLYASRPTLDYLGVTLEEWQSLSDWFGFFHPDDKERVANEVYAAAARDVPHEFEARFRRKDGAYRWFLFRDNPFRDEQGRIARWYLSATDIEERKRAEEALRLSNTYNRSLIEASLDPLVTIGPDGKITDVNGATEAATGCSRGELIGTDFCNYFTEPAQARAGYEQVFREGTGRDYHLELRHRSGRVMSVLYNASVYRDESGRVVGIFAAARDITERKRAEEALRESETRFRTFVDHAADAFFMLDFEKGTIIDVNQPACESLGYTREELIGMTPLAFDVDLDRATLESIAGRATAGETVVFDRHRHRRKDGSQFPVEVHTSVFSRGGRRFLLKVARDIGERVRGEEALRTSEEERRRTEKALQETRTELERVARVTTMGALTASIAHEVNQPLAGVVTSANAGLNWLAAHPPNLAKAREALERVRRDGTRAGEVIARIRGLVKRTPSIKVPLSVNQIVNEVLALAAGELRASHIETALALNPSLPAVLGDAIQLQQVLLNLITNAVEAMTGVQKGQRILRIQSALGELEGEPAVVAAVSDTGIGLGSTDVALLFEAFHTTKPLGMGIGLWISRSIIEEHGGRLTAQANSGQGATFTLTIPAGHEVTA